MTKTTGQSRQPTASPPGQGASQGQTGRAPGRRQLGRQGLGVVLGRDRSSGYSSLPRHPPPPWSPRFPRVGVRALNCVHRCWRYIQLPNGVAEGWICRWVLMNPQIPRIDQASRLHPWHHPKPIPSKPKQKKRRTKAKHPSVARAATNPHSRQDARSESSPHHSHAPLQARLKGPRPKVPLPYRPLCQPSPPSVHILPPPHSPPPS